MLLVGFLITAFCPQYNQLETAFHGKVFDLFGLAGHATSGWGLSCFLHLSAVRPCEPIDYLSSDSLQIRGVGFTSRKCAFFSCFCHHHHPSLASFHPHFRPAVASSRIPDHVQSHKRSKQRKRQLPFRLGTVLAICQKSANIRVAVTATCCRKVGRHDFHAAFPCWRATRNGPVSFMLRWIGLVAYWR